MKKLNLLKPNLEKKYLECGSGEKVEYLKIAEELTLQALEEDVKTGAIAYKDMVEGAKKGLSRVILIRSSSKENGLMAVNYLAGICNQLNREKGYGYDDFEDEMSDSYDVEALLEEFEIDYEDDLESNEECDTWYESPFRVPVLNLNELSRYAGEMQEFSGPTFISVGIPNVRNKKPYWTQCTREAVCIMAHSGYMADIYGNLNRVMDRFAQNKHVFILVIEPNLTFEFESEDPFGVSSYYEQHGLQFVLEYTADLFLVDAKESEIKQYREVQFENWAHALGVSLGKRFPKKDITEKIMSFNTSDKSTMMERVLKYILKEKGKREGDELDKDDFLVLRKFKALGLEEEKEKSNALKLERELIGMDTVKEQVRNIVSVMKYSKQREQMGLGRACFHNAHLLIGAPGTAKTTVAQLMGAMMFEENLLPGDRFVSVNGADLKGMYVGHSAPKTHQIFENYDVILIDEAYSLTSADGNDGMDSFGQEALAQLILEIENHPMDKLVMFAGYGGIHVSEKNNKMKQFIDANPGLKSRINSTIYFDSYNPDQMVEIVHIQAKNQKLVVDEAANSCIREYFKQRVKDQNFGNGREARSLLENAMMYAACRVMNLPERKRTKKVMTLIKQEDIQKAICRMTESDLMQTGRQRTKTGFAV